MILGLGLIDLVVLALIGFVASIVYLVCFGGLYGLYMKRRILSYHSRFKYPTFDADYKERDKWGNKVLDPFSWLEMPSPERSLWIEEQTTCTEKYFSSLKTTREKYCEQFKTLLQMSKHGTPFQRGKHYFYFKKEFDQDHYVLFRNDFDENVIEVLNPNKENFKQTDTFVVMTNVSNDGSMLAFVISESIQTKIVYT